MRAADRRSAQGVDRFVAPLRSVARRIKESYGADSQMLAPPIDCDLFQPDSPDSAPAGDHYLFCGRLIEPYKRITVARRGLQPARPAPGDRRRRPGPRRARAPRRAERRVPRSARRPGAGEAMRSCRAAVFPSRDDFGLVPVEVMACGRPVLAFAGGGATETVVPGVTGELFGSQEPEVIADAVRSFVPGRYDPPRSASTRCGGTAAASASRCAPWSANFCQPGVPTFVYEDMRRVIPLLTLLALLVWAAVPVGASAQDNSGLSQYQENPPTAGGGGGGGGHHGGGGGGGGHNGGGGAAGGGSGAAAGSSQSGGGSVSQSTVNQLDSMGADGQAAADAAIASTPPGSNANSSSNSSLLRPREPGRLGLGLRAPRAVPVAPRARTPRAGSPAVPAASVSVTCSATPSAARSPAAWDRPCRSSLASFS